MTENAIIGLIQYRARLWLRETEGKCRKSKKPSW
eukprot:CAMPEP_0175113612 /NCGR_PEP_ID=MMETSP0086_2-20121207/16269_1 /TAXON_ID=136419 /ORGANISM="Unknown Unknown, Strain D1" /LENGTH=33 /DNA_ID= /DNA_START= /DNA_END= /DNA_ORIENTATION=